MHSTTLLAALLTLCPVGAAAAQLQLPINPKATYLRTNNDTNAVPAPAIPISALGVAPGQWLSITTVGAYSSNGSSDIAKNLVCLFSSSSALLPDAPGQVSRVPGALLAGANYFTNNTLFNNLPTDIPQDFIVARTGWTNGTLVKVPAGATHIFLSVFNHNSNVTIFGSNSDPNSDYFVVFAPATPSPFIGTAEHCELRTGVNGLPSAEPEVKPASQFSTVSVDVVQRWGASSGQIWFLGANLYATGGAPTVGPLPGFHMGLDPVIVQVGITATTAGQWSFFVPPGHAGTTLILQGFFLSPTARNGLLESSNAHRIELQ